MIDVRENNRIDYTASFQILFVSESVHCPQDDEPVTHGRSLAGEMIRRHGERHGQRASLISGAAPPLWKGGTRLAAVGRLTKLIDERFSKGLTEI